jgi:hypothetical protein
MEGESTQPPLKVCRHCSVASRTDAETCPACGRPYRRTLSLWWWAAIPIVALAFGLGYGVTELVQDDDSDSGSISFETGRAIEIGVSRDEFDERVPEEPLLVETRSTGNAEAECLYYAIADEQRAWEFCFQDDRLATSRPRNVPPAD